MSRIRPLFFSSAFLLVFLGLRSLADEPRPQRAATLVVATADSSPASKGAADFVGDGQGDQEEINAALAALPEAGGTVLLMEGTYDIRKVEGALGGVLVQRSSVTLAGHAAGSKLVLAPDQNTNVIRIIGSGVGHVTVRDLYVDANRARNNSGAGDPNVAHDRFEFCGIKAYCRDPRGPAADPTHDITVRDCVVKNAHRLGIMLEGPNMRVLDNLMGNCTSDVVEILTGPGIIRGNYIEITEKTHVAVGSDRGNSIIMQGNVVHVKQGGWLDIGFRSWAESDRHVISDNVVTVDAEGVCTLAMYIRGRGAAVTGNNVHTSDPAAPTRIKITAGNVILSGNVLENTIIAVQDETGQDKPIVLSHNILENSQVEHSGGRLVRADGPPAAK
ncbi:MAG: hypothetical protein HUU20_17790 [Pirellulales bacterium]|nr:hypothetical protein [Pirellulales bacterium]